MRTAWRAALVLAGAVALSGCEYAATPDPVLSARDKAFIAQVPKADMGRVFDRYEVDDPTGQPPGTIVVDIDKRQLALVQADGTAMQYGVGVGKLGFSWKGEARVGRKGVWPDWSPTTTMVALHPEIDRQRKGGLDNPLGARALYLYQGNRDILFRIHGTNEPWSIGEQMSSGCVRMLNEDIADLYERVPVGTRVLVKRSGKYRT